VPTCDENKDSVPQGCGSGSVLGIRIQGQENEEISVEKCTFYYLFKKILRLKRYKIALLFEKNVDE
jgi:hypothetical protein